MASVNAYTAAQKVSETIRKGKKIVLGKILLESGYTKSTSESPTHVTNTKTYKKAMKPLVDGLHEEIERIKLQLATRDLTEEKYRDLADVLNTLIKNFQLLSGGATERVINVDISEAIAKKNNLNGSSYDTKSSS